MNGPPVIGSGPYQVVENKHNSYCRLVPNPDYWGGRPAVDELFFESYQNADTMVQDLKAGTLDAASGVPAAQFKGLGVGQHHDQRGGVVVVRAAHLQLLRQFALPRQPGPP